MRTVAFCLALAGAAAASVLAAPLSAGAKIHRVFDIHRGSDKIGTETVDIEHQGETTTVKTKTDVSVTVLFVEAYRYGHSSSEVWKGGQLVSFQSQTDDNGTKHIVKVSAGADGLTLEADGKRSVLPKTAVPASLWNKDALRQTDAFEPDTGRRLSLQMTDLGPDEVMVNGVKHQAHHYKIADTLKGEYARELWYDGDVLVRTKLIGSDNSVILSELR